jgi:uncharacterized membrane protein YqjE
MAAHIPAQVAAVQVLPDKVQLLTLQMLVMVAMAFKLLLLEAMSPMVAAVAAREIAQRVRVLAVLVVVELEIGMQTRQVEL